MKANFHTHTPRCQHASGTEEEYARAAAEAGFEVLGFSDHCPWPYRTGYVSRIRMTCEELDGYIAAVHRVREEWAGRLRGCLGMEAEYYPDYVDHLRRMRDQGIDYYLLGQHAMNSEEYPGQWTASACEEDDDSVLRFADSITEGVRTGLYACVAHPDIYLRRRPPERFNRACEEAADRIAQVCIEQNIPVEYNLLGLDCRKRGESNCYPVPAFWQYLSRWKVKTIIGVDAHDPALLGRADLWQEGMDTLTSLGFEVLDRLPVKGV